MSAKHPIISITGSSGAGTTSVKRIFEQIFRREKIEAAFIEGDAFHRYDRLAMKDKVAEEEKGGNPNFTHFHAEANELRSCTRSSRNTAAGAPAAPAPMSMTRKRKTSTARRPAPSPNGASFPIATCSSTKACTAAR